ncbi:sigma-70 family RNA polymerase sigma factor [bacterium]|nr:sigma-70 family RNA polymerase sigma factor [bacterium]
MTNLEDIVLRAQLGDGEAYGLLVRRFQDMALSYAFSFLGDLELAEDARQEAFLGAYCDLLALRDPAAFPGWFRQIVRKHSIAIRRGRRVLMVPLEDAAEPVSSRPGPVEQAQSRQVQERVEQAIENLPLQERETTRLFHLDGFSMREIATRLEIPEKTVKSRLYSARERLRYHLMELVKDTVQDNSRPHKKPLLTAASQEAIAGFEQELGSLLRTPSHDDYLRAGDLVCAKGRLLRFMGRMNEAFAAFRDALDIPGLKKNPLTRARLRAEIGLTYVQVSDYDSATRELRYARTAIRKLGDTPALLAAVENGLGMCAWGKGNFTRARRYYEQTIEISRAARCDVLEAEARNNLALVDWKAGRLARAQASFRQCVDQWQELKNRFGQALSLMNLGILEENQDHAIPARKCYLQSLKLAEEIGFLQLQSACHGNLANLALIEERWDEAREEASKSLKMAESIGDRRSQAIALENLALAEIGARRFAETARALRKARKLATQTADAERRVSLDLVEAESLLEQENPAKAGQLLDKAEPILRKSYPLELGRFFRLRARQLILSHQPENARKALREALKLCEKQGNKMEQRRVTRFLQGLDKTPG